MLKKRFFNTYKFSSVYPYDWKKFSKTLPEKGEFQSYLNVEDITYADYAHVEINFKDLEIKNLGEYHSLHLQSDVSRNI